MYLCTSKASKLSTAAVKCAGFIHHMVRPTSIMMDEEHNTIVLVDFGSCRYSVYLLYLYISTNADT